MRGVAIAGAFVAAGVVGACFSPRVQPGGACTPDLRCPAPLVCDSASHICLEPDDDGGPDAGPDCVRRPEVCDGVDQDCDDAIDEDFAVGTDCVVGIGACAAAGTEVCNSAQTGVDCMASEGGPDAEVCGDGIDQDCDDDDPACPPNDAPGGAIDVSAGGTFVGELATARDDANGACGAGGGRDLFYELVVPDDEVVYVDSFGSDFDVVIRVMSGACTEGAGELGCLDDECGAQAQGAGEVPAGTSCIVVDQGGGAGETHGHVELHVARGRRPGIELPYGTGTITGTTAGEDNLSVPMCEDDSKAAPDVGYFFTVCAGATVTVEAWTCDNTPYDSWLSIREGNGRSGPELECLDDEDDCGSDGDDDDSYVTHDVTGPGLFWVLVDGYAGEAGPYQLDYSIE